MSLLSSHSSTTENYIKVESLIGQANKTSNDDANLKLSLYMKAMFLLIQIQELEKKEQFRNFYEQRIKDVQKQVEELQYSRRFPNSHIDTYKIPQNSSKLNESSHKNPQIIDSPDPLSLYPTLPDLDPQDLDQNNLSPTINPVISNLDSGKQQVQTQILQPFQQNLQNLFNANYRTQEIPPRNYMHDNNPQAFPPSYPSAFLPSYPNFEENLNSPDYPFPIPTIQPEIIKIEDEPLSQPGQFSDTNSDFSNPKCESFSDSNVKKKKKQSNTEIFKEDMLVSNDHFEDEQKKDYKSSASFVPKSNNNKNKSMNDSFGDLEDQINEIKKKKKHHSKKKPNVSDKIIDIPENFKIESFLGHGTFGNVYLATEYSSQKKFAIKELKDFDENGENSVSFFREIEALSKANHPAVLHLYGFSLLISREKRYPAIVTEYLSGGTLYDVIKGRKNITMTEKLIILYGMCEAMHYLHDKLKIVHRDLKPENVMLNSNNEPIICDFGLSKMMSEKYMMKSQTAGSPIYMAPELLRDEEYSDKVDVYSYGIIAYEILTGKLAYPEAKNIKELRSIVLSGERPSLENEDNIHQKFKNLIQSCWQDNEALRPTFYELALRFRKMEFVVDNCNKKQFRKYVRRCLHKS